MRSSIGGLLLGVILLAVAGTGAAAASDPLTGSWVLDDPDGSTSWTHISAPGPDGVREVSLFDTYGTVCETAGPGTGSPVSGHGSAVENGTQVTLTITSIRCANGAAGAVTTPFTTTATLTSAGLDFGSGFVATRPGRG